MTFSGFFMDSDPLAWKDIPTDLRAAIPNQLFLGLSDYVEHHIETGGFLRCVLENNLIGAVQYAHPQSRACFFEIVSLLAFAPAKCYGSPERVERWLQERPPKGSTARATEGQDE